MTLGGVLMALFTVSTVASAADIAGVRALLDSHCADCHANGTADGGLDLQTLGHDLTDVAAFATWERIHDRVRDGEMPPADADQPTAEQRTMFVDSLNRALTAAHSAQKGTVLRRLNRQEYQNTMNDLFGTNLKLAERLPVDGRSDEFDTVGEALGISLVQMRQYLESAEAVLDASIAQTVEQPPSKVTRSSYADTRGGERFLGDAWLLRDDGAVVFFRRLGYPTGMLRETNVDQDGWYNVRVTGYAFQSAVPITFSVGATTFLRGVERPTFAYFSFPPGPPTTIEVRVWMPARYMVEVTPWGIGDPNYEIRNKGIENYTGPGLAINHIEVEGPLIDEFPSRGHRLLFDGLDRSEVMPSDPKTRQKSWYKPKFEIGSGDSAVDVVPVLRRVARRAFRRPVETPEVASYLALFNSELELGSTVEDSLRAAVTAIFCSPDFLYLRENAGLLDDHALASRLSYFLTRTTPDDQLLGAAASGTLASEQPVLLAQAERLLDDTLSGRFVNDFTDAWLNLRDIEFTNPDGTLFPEFDAYLQFSMVDETRMYFRKLLDENLSVTNLVKSDFAMLNERLAEHYDIAGVQGPQMRPVELPNETVRGGLLTQGSVLKVSANGNNTSPVVRGVWVLERILGTPPPPPPAGIPGVEPDVRGATTLRELLEKHRDLPTCNSCHQQIDPPGFALESFNPIGGWRDRFRSLGEGDEVDKEIDGRRVRYKLGPRVDSSGQFADGRQFDGFMQFRDLLAADQDRLARTLTIKLLTFATGREMGFSDRAEIDGIVSESAATGHGVRNLLRLVITSKIFRHK